ncbi:MAG: hypothetical protein II777_07005 [Clostridia bacterium]|nr:hypothetical protein [Clostridia bacterium]
MKKTLALLICALFVLTAFLACSPKNPENPSDTSSVTKSQQNDTASVTAGPEETAEVGDFEIDEEIAARKSEFNGYTLNILCSENTADWPADDLYREEDSDEALDSAIYTRNVNVKDKYGFDIEVFGSSGPSADTKKAVNSNDTSYDVVVYTAHEMCVDALANMYLDLTQISTINLSKSYWDQKLFDGLNIDGKLFYTTGDISTKAAAGTFICIYNKKVAADYDYEGDVFYDMVYNKQWTLDKLLEIVKTVKYIDDGDSKLGPEDFFPLAIQIEDYLAFFFGAGGHIITRDENGMPMYGLNIAGNKTAEIVDKIYNLTKKDNQSIDAHDYLPYLNEHGSFASSDAFKDNRALFYFTNASNLLGLRDMDSDFGVLPMPMFDEKQDGYSCYVYWSACLFAIPSHMSHRSEFIGFALEAMADESHKVLTPAYYEVTLKTKGQRDPTSQEMFDIACRNRVWDLGYTGSMSLADIGSNFITQIKKGSGTLANFNKSNERRVNKAIDKLLKAYNKS